MISLLVAIILIYVISLSSANQFNFSLCRDPTGCKHLGNQYAKLAFLCDHFPNQVDYLPVLNSPKYCPSFSEYYYEIFVRTSKNDEILSNSSEIFSIVKHLPNVYYFSFSFLNLRGIDFQSIIYIKPDLNYHYNLITTTLYFQNSFRFVDRNGKLLKTCEEFERANSHEFVFKAWQYLKIIVQESRDLVICPIVFRKAILLELIVKNYIRSFYKQVSIRYLNYSSRETDLGCYINSFYLNDAYGVRIDSNLLDRELFKNTQGLHIYGQVESIQTDIFRHLTKITYLSLFPDEALKIFLKQGIEWLKAINSHVKVNMSNQSDIATNFGNYLAVIHLSQDREFLINRNKQYAYDEDFCLFIHFPFQQLIVFEPAWVNSRYYWNSWGTQPVILSCTVRWLFKYHIELNRLGFYVAPNVIESLDKSNIQCDFEKRIRLCEKKNFHINKINESKETKFSSFDFMTISELLVNLISSVMSVFGIVTNFLVVFTLLKKENFELRKEKHYIYMAIHCVSNIAILLIQLISLINECHYPHGLYCSSIRHLVVVQYMKMIIGEGLNGTFRFISSITYLAFSLNRLSKIGKDHNPITTFVSTVGIRKFMTITILFSLVISTPNGLKYIINLSNLDRDYPFMFTQIPLISNWQSKTKLMVVFIFNFIYNILNYFVFVALNLVIDLMLIRKLYQVLKEKEAKLNVVIGLSDKAKEKLKKDNDESKRRAILMVVLFTTTNFIAKFPTLLISINDLRIHIITKNSYLTFGSYGSLGNVHWYTFPYNFKYFCSLERSCALFRSLGNCLYLISLLTVFFFLKKFDLNFHSAFHFIFPKKEQIINNL